MRYWIVQIRPKKRKDFPESFILEAKDYEAKELEQWIRDMFDAGVIKDFLFQPVTFSKYQELSKFLASIDKRP